MLGLLSYLKASPMTNSTSDIDEDIHSYFITIICEWLNPLGIQLVEQDT